MSELRSALYLGHVRHRRRRPQAHAFRYRIAQLYADLDELDAIVAGQRLWSLGRRNLAAFHRADYHGDPGRPLKQAVLDSVEAASGVRPDGAVRLLAHWRYYGYCFNPVSFYYCFDAGGALHSILAEITNTPWGERHAYVLPLAQASHHGRDARVHAWCFDKAFHVSPFLPMDLRYDWRFEEPGENLRVHMDVSDAQGSIFDATLVMQRRAIEGAVLTRFLLDYPAMTAMVAFRIYWNALRIRLKRNPFFDHPRAAK